jgi:hypothetical protein
MRLPGAVSSDAKSEHCSAHHYARAKDVSGALDGAAHRIGGRECLRIDTHNQRRDRMRIAYAGAKLRGILRQDDQSDERQGDHV